jgi:hypothetical protein
MAWDLIFEPFLSWPLTIAAGLLGLVLIAIAILTHSRGWPQRGA